MKSSRDYPCLASAAPLDTATAEVKFRLLLKAQNRFDGAKTYPRSLAGAIARCQALIDGLPGPGAHCHNCLICSSWSVNWRREHGGHERVNEPCFCSCGALLYAHRPEPPDTIDAPFEP